MLERLPMEGFPVTEVDGVVRRTLLGAAGAAAIGVAAASSLRHPLVGVGVIIGLVLGAINNRMFTSSALRFTTEEGKVRRGVLGTSVARRLGGVTIVAFGLLWFARPVGWGVLAGLAVFQMLLMVNALKALMAFHRGEAGVADG
ncbi:MAG TPA: hypothetical protein VFH45_04245 [Acidimicrobiales bacterium]|nr:hypothetical protein [Acidimicrobiales bacterium]